MLINTALRWSYANVLTKRRMDTLLAKFGSLETAFEHIDLDLLQSLGCREDTAMATMNRLEEFDADGYLQALKKRKLELLSIEDPLYPSSLKNLPDPPIFLYVRGDLKLLDQPCIALVGTRAMSPYGKRVTEYFVPPIVAAGVVTVSGLALGIDAEVARQTLQAGGKTVAVLGHGLGNIYPKENERLAENIIEKGGLLLSEFPLDIKPDKYTFPGRNRIIAGLSAATIVLEAATESGSLITADLALHYGRDIFAVPGQIFDPNYAGCHEIILKGHAQLVSQPEDVLKALNIIGSSRATENLFQPRSEAENLVFSVLTSMPQSSDTIVLKTSLDASTVSSTLTMLDLAGVAKNIGGGEWVKG